MDLDQFAAAFAAMGLKSIELTTPEQWPTLKKHNLICAMTPSHSIVKGLNRLQNHEECLAKVKKGIDDSAAAGFPNVICFSGNREGMDDQEGLANCIAGLKKIAGYAETKQVTVCLEFLNSVHDHHDYMADSTKWCVGLVHGVGSPRVKVLYDIYHAGMMKEDVLADVKEHHDCWGHFHNGGVPGRNEIDDSQTLATTTRSRRRSSTRAIRGYMAQEFVPKRKEAMKTWSKRSRFATPESSQPLPPRRADRRPFRACSSLPGLPFDRHVQNARIAATASNTAAMVWWAVVRIAWMAGCKAFGSQQPLG